MPRVTLTVSATIQSNALARINHAQRGQAILETVLAVFFLAVVFLVFFHLARLLQARILLDHAAARAARARSVGFNEFMCLKSARVAMIPAAGKRLWPTDDDWSEVARIPIYLCTQHEGVAAGVLDYEHWHTMSVKVRSSGGIGGCVEAEIQMKTPDFTVEGQAEIESHHSLYLQDFGQ